MTEESNINELINELANTRDSINSLDEGVRPKKGRSRI